MCISIPARVLETTDTSALVEVGPGLTKKVLLAPGVEAREWVLIYGGIAISDITVAEAKEMLLLLEALA